MVPEPTVGPRLVDENQWDPLPLRIIGQHKGI